MYYVAGLSPFAASLLFPHGLSRAHAKVQESFSFETAEGFDPQDHVIPAGLLFSIP